jgi:hypothetical protein
MPATTIVNPDRLAELETVTLADWNDQDDRTAEEVAEALERAAYGV